MTTTGGIMSLFKKNITISQFTADAINNSYDFYDSNIDKMLEMENADEFKVMNSKDKAELKEFGYSLITADLLLSIMLHFSDKISSEEAGELITSLNIKYLKEVKQLEISEIEKKTNKLIELLDHLEKKEGETDGSADGLRIILCQVFSEMFSSGDLRDTKVEGKRFAAFKLAKAIVKSDLINIMQKDYKIDFSH